MIKSKYVSDILDLLLDGDEVGRKARRQVEFLTEKSVLYTGVGVFVSFDHSDGIEEFKLSDDNSVINGVEIGSADLEIGAEAMVHTINGLIDHLEIWSYSGKYPDREFTNYILTQGWLNGQGRKIEVR